MEESMAGELYSLAAEQAVIGGLILECAAWSRISGVTAADFYRPDHRTIFAAIEQLTGVGKAFDLVVLGDHLERRGQLTDVGGLAYLGTLAKETPGTANIAAYAATVRDWSLRRQLKAFAERADRAASCGTEDGETIMQRMQEQLLQLQAATRIGTGLVDSKTLAHAFIDDLDNRRDRQHGLNIGLSDFDDLTHGLEPGDLVVIAARPGMGKTALAVTVAAHAALNLPVAVFSAEMPSRQLTRRCVALLGTISQGKLRRADQLTNADWDVITPAVNDLANRYLWIDDTSSPAMSHIRAECLSLKARAGLGLVLIDYVQLVQGVGANRYEQLRHVAYECKALAKDLSVPVIVLAQLNRGVESRDSKRAHASDLRDSGAIEEAADIIGLLYCEGYYNREFAMPDVLECRVEKNRNGETGQLLLWQFVGQYSRVTVLDSGDRAEYRRLLAQQNASHRRAGNDL
jgi:replicative DNA helicase